MIVGVGTDVVSVARFSAALERTPTLADRLFTPAELLGRYGRPRTSESLAARFAAKEAVAKALGGPPGLRFTDAQITTADTGAPVLAVTGSVARAADQLGVDRWHVSLTHDGGLAHAVVIAERTVP